MRINRILAGICALTLTFSGVICDNPSANFALTAYAADSGSIGDNLTWTLDDNGVLTISGEGEWDPQVEIPAKIRTQITSIIIEEGVTSIGYSALGCCIYLTSVSLPDSLTKIGALAFHGCFSLEKITIPDGVTAIEECAFDHCDVLADVTIPESVTEIGQLAFADTPWLTNQQAEIPLVIVNGILIDGTTASGAVTVPEDVTVIAEYAFKDNENITSVVLGEHVSVVGCKAFFGCTALKSITFLNPACTPLNDRFIITNKKDYSVVIRGYAGSTAQTFADKWGYAFEALDDAPAATSGTLGDNLTWTLDDNGVLTISGEGEWDPLVEIPAKIRTQITSVIIEEGVTSIGYSALGCCIYLTSVSLPDSLTKIGALAFHGCFSLEKITIPDGVTAIEECAFDHCDVLADVTIPESVTEIGQLAFADTPWLTNQQAENPLVIVNGILIDGTTASGAVTVPEDVTVIAEGAFKDNENITSVVLGEHVSVVGCNAFFGCTALKSITFLNPACTPLNDRFIITNKKDYSVVIRGYAGSTAQTFADKWGYAFEALGPVPSSAPDPDLDGDGMITAGDAQAVLIAYADLISGNEPDMTPEQRAAADVDGSGDITALDAQYILTYYLCNSVLDDPTAWEEIIRPDGE